MPKSTQSSKTLAKEARSKKSSAIKKTQQQPPPKTLSTETVEDSDREDESGTGDSDAESLPKHPAKAKAKRKTNGKVAALAESSSSSESESESEDTDESSSEESVEEIVVPKSKGSRDITSTVNQSPSEAVKTNGHTPAPPYKPPTGFKYTSITDPPEILREVKKAASSGKQIWYFTAPAAVPISSIKDMSLLGIENGDVAASHNETEYGFVQEHAEEMKTTNVLIPNTSDDGYRAVSKPVDRVLHLTQLVKLPGASGTNEATSKATIPAEKPVRQQPKGLKMRYLPLGCEGVGGTLGFTSSEEASDSDVEMEEAPKKFKNLAPLPATDPDHEMTEAPPLQKKSSKSHKSSKTDTAVDVTTKKRKHGEKSEKKSKSSSLKPNEDNNDRQLKALKKRQIIPHSATADERRISMSPRPLPKKLTAVPPPPKPAHPTPASLRSILKTSRPPQAVCQEEPRGEVKAKKRKNDNKETSKTHKRGG